MELPIDKIDEALRGLDEYYGENLDISFYPRPQIHFGPVTGTDPDSIQIAASIVQAEPLDQEYPLNSLPQVFYTVEVVMAGQLSLVQERVLFEQYLRPIVTNFICCGFRFKGANYGALVDRNSADHVMSIRFTQIL